MDYNFLRSRDHLGGTRQKPPRGQTLHLFYLCLNPLLWEQSVTQRKGTISPGSCRTASRLSWAGQAWAQGHGFFKGRARCYSFGGPSNTHFRVPPTQSLAQCLYTIDIQCMSIECGWNILKNQIQPYHFDRMMAFFLDDFGGETKNALERLCLSKMGSHLRPPSCPYPEFCWALPTERGHLRCQLSSPLKQGFRSSGVLAQQLRRLSRLRELSFCPGVLQDWNLGTEAGERRGTDFFFNILALGLLAKQAQSFMRRFTLKLLRCKRDHEAIQGGEQVSMCTNWFGLHGTR